MTKSKLPQIQGGQQIISETQSVGLPESAGERLELIRENGTKVSSFSIHFSVCVPWLAKSLKIGILKFEPPAPFPVFTATAGEDLAVRDLNGMKLNFYHEFLAAELLD